MSVERRLGVEDRAGNPLKANLLSGDTQTTIIVGSVNMDFGDSPETAGGHYPTRLGLNGAAHMITEPPLYLGGRVDAERDGQVSAGANGDDNDSNGFAVSTAGVARVTTSAPQTPAVLQLPQPLTLLISDGLTLRDGAIFTVTNNGLTVAFEYDNNNSLVSVGSTRIPFAVTDTLEQIAETTVAALSADASLGLVAVLRRRGSRPPGRRRRERAARPGAERGGRRRIRLRTARRSPSTCQEPADRCGTPSSSTTSG